ncbi:MAG: phosphorylase [Cyanobacteria bacterium J06633_2]
MANRDTTQTGLNLLQPGMLWEKVQARTIDAIACGALQSIPTHRECVEHNGVSFLVRSLDTLTKKEKAKKAEHEKSDAGKPFDPFLPYEEDLFVTDLSTTHLCLLNKFNVVDHHLLIVTRAFEEQEDWLNPQDFSALWRVLREIDGLGFYNGGKLAGASQPHKHMQLIPPLQSTDTFTFPIESAFQDLLFPSTQQVSSSLSDSLVSKPQSSHSLPFNHAIASLSIPLDYSASQGGDQLMQVYRQLLASIAGNIDLTGDRQALHYNLLVTRRWMMLVPRSQESYASISVNSLGFAGSLFVKDEKQLQILRQTGPMTVLENVAQPKPPQ